MSQNVTRDHWWWRPGWKPGRSFYTWHVTFGDDSLVGDLVDRFAATLAQMPTMAPVPRDWLHVTVQGVGFTDAVSDVDIRRIGEAARKHLAQREPFDVVVGPPAADRETVGMPIAAGGALGLVRADLQKAIADVWGSDHVPERGNRFVPHLSVAYSTGEASVPDLNRMLVRGGLNEIRVAETVSEISLIELDRDRRQYEWREILKVPLGR